MEMTFAEMTAQWANDFLVWVGFGTLVGLLARAIMPGKDVGGPLATLLMGISGTVIGCGGMMFITGGQRVTPISIVGFIVATVGAFVLLAFARFFGPKRTLVRSERLTGTHRRRSAPRAEVYEEIEHAA